MDEFTFDLFDPAASPAPGLAGGPELFSDFLTATRGIANTAVDAFASVAGARADLERVKAARDITRARLAADETGHRLALLRTGAPGPLVPPGVATATTAPAAGGFGGFSQNQILAAAVVVGLVLMVSK